MGIPILLAAIRLGKMPCHLQCLRAGVTHPFVDVCQLCDLPLDPRLFHPLAISNQTAFVPNFRQGILVIHRTSLGPFPLGFSPHFLDIQRTDFPQLGRSEDRAFQSFFPRGLVLQHVGGSQGHDCIDGVIDGRIFQCFDGARVRRQAAEIRSFRPCNLRVGDVRGQEIGCDGSFFLLGLRPPRVRFELNNPSCRLGHFFCHHRHLLFHNPFLHFQGLNLIGHHVPAPLQ